MPAKANKSKKEGNMQQITIKARSGSEEVVAGIDPFGCGLQLALRC